MSSSRCRPGQPGRGRRKLLSELLDRLTSVEARLSALERRVGTTAPDLRDLLRRRGIDPEDGAA